MKGIAEFTLGLTDLKVDESMELITSNRMTIDGETAKTLKKIGGGATVGVHVEIASQTLLEFRLAGSLNVPIPVVVTSSQMCLWCHPGFGVQHA